MARSDLVVRIAGESGEGVISTGDLATQAAARAGFRVLTFKTYPAEIKGGHALFQLRLADHDLYTVGDEVDVLVAFNPEVYQINAPDLRPGGLVIYDSTQFGPQPNPQEHQYPVPLTDIARQRLQFELGKNVVAAGAVVALLGLPAEYVSGLLRERFGRRGPEIVERNLAALRAGTEFVEHNLPERSDYLLKVPETGPAMMVASGNQALAIGAIAGGCRYFFGYPITPGTDIMELLATELPKLGGAVVQAEDEISAIGMVLGASYAGNRAMTATSGPGFSLMTEMLGLAAMAEIPCVVADIQRAGPSTGMPTKHEQGDLYLATTGGHGEVQRIVLAPTSVEDCFYQAVNAFNLAEKYQMPVILLSDTVIATRTQSIPIPDLAHVQLWSRVLYEGDSHLPANGPPDVEHRFHRYEVTGSGVSPTSVPGDSSATYTATGLEHSVLGRPRYDPETRSEMTRKRFRKQQAASLDAPPAEYFGDPGAEIGIITWGSTTGFAREAVELARQEGFSVAGMAPRMLSPVPDAQVSAFLRAKRAVIVPEVNFTGQLAQLLRARHGREFTSLNIYGGIPFKVSEILQSIRQVAQHV